VKPSLVEKMEKYLRKFPFAFKNILDFPQLLENIKYAVMFQKTIFFPKESSIQDPFILLGD
jgi:hypothetical protein